MFRRMQFVTVAVGLLAAGCFDYSDEVSGVDSNLQPSSCQVGVTGSGWEPCAGTKNCMELDVGPVAVQQMRQVNLRLQNDCHEPVLVTMGESDAPDGSVDLGGDGSPDPNAPSGEIPIPAGGYRDLDPNLVVLIPGDFTLHCQLFDAHNLSVDHGVLRIKGVGY